RRVELQFSPSILFLFLRGLAKKVLVADNLGSLIGIVFAKPHLWPSTVIWIATIAFAIQIYCDFSGYSDMARALARLFGFEMPRNLDERLSRAPLAVQAVACAIIGAAFVLFWPNTSAPFIYFQF